MFHFSFYAVSARTEDTKRAPTVQRSEPREKPIRFAHGEVNRVTRIGAFPGLHTKKQPWVGVIAAELTNVSSGQDHRPQRVRLPRESKALCCPPLFCRVPNTAWTFRGPKSATRSIWTSHPMKWSWHLNALPRSGQPSARRMVGEVSGQGSMRSGAGREATVDLYAPRISGKRRYAQSR